MEAVHAAMGIVGSLGVDLAAGAGLFFGSAAAGLGAVTCALVCLPADYLDRSEAAPFLPGRPRWVRVAGKIGKNVLGAAALGAGALLAVPGVPGPGLLTMLLGATLLDIPGKRRLERRILGSPRVLPAVNRLRATFGRRPLRVRSDLHEARSAVGA